MCEQEKLPYLPVTGHTSEASLAEPFYALFHSRSALRSHWHLVSLGNAFSRYQLVAYRAFANNPRGLWLYQVIPQTAGSQNFEAPGNSLYV